MIKPFCALVAAAMLSLASPQAADAAEPIWIRAESPNFVIYTDTSADAAQAYARTLEQFDAVLRMQHGMEAEPARRKLPVYLLRRKGDLRRIAPNLNPDIAGFYRSHMEDTYAVATELRGKDSVLLHEYVHHFMLQHYPFGYPAWLIEGYAEYYATFDSTAEYVEIGKHERNRADWLTHARWMSFEHLLKAQPHELSSSNAAMFYAQSWALTHWFLSDRPRSRQLDAYIKAVAAGSDPVSSFKDTTGLGSGALAQTLVKYLSRGFPYKRLHLKDLPNPTVTVTRMTPAASDVILVNLRIMADNGIDAPEDRSDGPVLLKAVRDSAKPHSGDRFADLVLARGEAKLGDQAEAERILLRLLEANANDVEAMQVLADLKLKQADAASGEQRNKLRAGARTLAGRAYKIAPDNYQTLVAYARGREGAAGYPNENDLNVLLDALDLAPQVGRLRLNTARALVHHKRYQAAYNVLGPLANNPHGGEAVGAARQLIALMQATGQIAPAAAPAAKADD